MSHDQNRDHGKSQQQMQGDQTNKGGAKQHDAGKDSAHQPKDKSRSDHKTK